MGIWKLKLKVWKSMFVFSDIYFFLMVCLNFSTAKLSSIVVSLSEVCRSLSNNSEIISPLFCIKDCYFSFSGFEDSSLTACVSSLTLAKVSMMAKVVSLACLLFNMVAIM